MVFWFQQVFGFLMHREGKREREDFIANPMEKSFHGATPTCRTGLSFANWSRSLREARRPCAECFLLERYTRSGGKFLSFSLSAVQHAVLVLRFVCHCASAMVVTMTTRTVSCGSISRLTANSALVARSQCEGSAPRSRLSLVSHS